jgi:hypothetical protein
MIEKISRNPYENSAEILQNYTHKKINYVGIIGVTFGVFCGVDFHLGKNRY